MMNIIYILLILLWGYEIDCDDREYNNSYSITDVESKQIQQLQQRLLGDWEFQDASEIVEKNKVIIKSDDR